MRRLPRMNHFFVLGPLAAAGVLVAGIYAAGTGAQTNRTEAVPNLVYVKKQLDTWSAVPKFAVPNVPFDASKAKGKTVFNLPVSTHVPFNQDYAKAFEDVLKSFGVKYILYPNEASPIQWVKGMQQAVTQKVDLINLQGTDPSLLGPQIAAANRANIPVVSAHVFNATAPKPKTLTAVVRNDWDRVGRLMADWIIWDTKGKANVLLVDSADIPIGHGIIKAIKSEFARSCGPSCKVNAINVPVPEWTTKMQTAVQSELVRDPSIDYILPLFDPEILWIIPAIKAIGKVGQVHIATSGGTAFALQDMQKNDIVRANVAYSPNILGLMNADTVLRLLAGVKPLYSVHPLRLFTRANVREAGPSGIKGYGNAYEVGYKKLWSGK
jgi:ribose transport system substrate-binding protein